MMVLTDIVGEKEAEVLIELKTTLMRVVGDRLSSVILFGSRVRGDADEDSDLDVAIVVSGLERNLKKIILDLVADIELRHLSVISSFVVSTNDFERLRLRERRIALDIEKDGITI